ncbi:MAG: lamin tail domain-containing protein [Myxococcales bacterium]|nr:lamin tail domain-containing protein [Myxococcales bacterium]
MPPSGGDAQQQQQQQYDTGAIPTYDSYVFPDTGGGGQEDAGTSTFADTGSGQQDAGASATKPPATCSSSGLRISEVAVGTLDFVVLKNNGSGPIDLAGYKLEMYGINGNKPVEHTFAAKTIAAGESVYVLEYEKGTAGTDVNTKQNIPFYNGPPSAMKPNAVGLYDAAGALVDYWAVDKAVGIPANASFTPMSWGTFDSKKSSFQRVADTGACPNFNASDWGTAALSR